MAWKIRACFLAFVSLICHACATLGFDQDYSKPRNYVVTISDEQHGPIMQIVCNYVGKKPDGRFHGNIDWKAKRPDFYNFSFRNLTDHPIKLLSLRSHSKYPSTYTLHSPVKPEGAISQLTPDILEWDLQKLAFHGVQRLEPYETPRFYNLYYYGGVPFNIRFHELTCQWQGKTYRQTFYQIYKKGGP